MSSFVDGKFLGRRLIRTGAEEERGSVSSSASSTTEGLVSKDGVDKFLSTSKLSSPCRVRSLNWFTLVSPESCRNLRILKSAAVLGLLKISLPTEGGLGSERRRAAGPSGGRGGGEGE